jgi:hypothetical protein
MLHPSAGRKKTRSSASASASPGKRGREERIWGKPWPLKTSAQNKSAGLQKTREQREWRDSLGEAKQRSERGTKEAEIREIRGSYGERRSRKTRRMTECRPYRHAYTHTLTHMHTYIHAHTYIHTHTIIIIRCYLPFLIDAL